jgi:hypothetical protein
MRSGLRLEIRYDGYHRVVEVHACGYTREDNPVMRVWQVHGGGVRNEPIGWKLLSLDEALGLAILSEKSDAPRLGYKRGDKAMARIVCPL